MKYFYFSSYFFFFKASVALSLSDIPWNGPIGKLGFQNKTFFLSLLTFLAKIIEETYFFQKTGVSML